MKIRKLAEAYAARCQSASKAPWAQLTKSCIQLCTILESSSAAAVVSSSLKCFPTSWSAIGAPANISGLSEMLMAISMQCVDRFKISICVALTFLVFTLVNCGSRRIVRFDGVYLGVCFQARREDHGRLVKNIPNSCVGPILSSAQLSSHTNICRT